MIAGLSWPSTQTGLGEGHHVILVQLYLDCSSQWYPGRHLIICQNCSWSRGYVIAIGVYLRYTGWTVCSDSDTEHGNQTRNQTHRFWSRILDNYCPAAVLQNTKPMQYRAMIESLWCTRISAVASTVSEAAFLIAVTMCIKKALVAHREWGTYLSGLAAFSRT